MCMYERFFFFCTYEYDEQLIMIDKWTHKICNDRVLQQYRPQYKNHFPVQRTASLQPIYTTANVHFNQFVV